MGKHDASKKHAHKRMYPIYFKTPDGRELRDCGYSEEEAIQRCVRRLATPNSKRRRAGITPRLSSSGLPICGARDGNRSST